jgi:hypothetical protein
MNSINFGINNAIYKPSISNYRIINMAEQIIDIRERIEKMRIKFQDDHKSNIHDEPNLEKNVSYENKKRITNLENEFNNLQKEEIKSNYIKDLSKSETLTQNSKEFPSVQLSVKNPISSKVLVFLMLLQVFSNIGIFMLLLNVLE